MASIRMRETGNWEVQVRKRGFPAQVRTFDTKKAATDWAKKIEADMERLIWQDPRELQKTGFTEILDRYRNEVSTKRKGATQEISRINGFKAFKPFHRPLIAITPREIADYKRMREQAGCRAATIGRELAMLSAIFSHAKQEWGFTSMTNPASADNVKRPAKKADESRDRLASDEEIAAIVKQTGSPYLSAAVRLALETTMRRSEIAGLHWKYVEIEEGLVTLTDTKNATSRTVPLSPRAIKVLESVPGKHTGYVFKSPRDPEKPIRADAITRAWTRARQKEMERRGASVGDLRFHDLRHTATTNLFGHPARLREMEVAAITGHKDLRSLKRYSHIQATTLRDRLGWARPTTKPAAPKRGK